MSKNRPRTDGRYSYSYGLNNGTLEEYLQYQLPLLVLTCLGDLPPPADPGDVRISSAGNVSVTKRQTKQHSRQADSLSTSTKATEPQIKSPAMGYKDKGMMFRFVIVFEFLLVFQLQIVRSFLIPTKFRFRGSLGSRLYSTDENNFPIKSDSYLAEREERIMEVTPRVCSAIPLFAQD